MHGTLFLALDKSHAKTSLAARRAAYNYLGDEGFTPFTRFGGCADSYCVGGRASCTLAWMRLEREQPEAFRAFTSAYRPSRPLKERIATFRKVFPDYKGMVPVDRDEDAPEYSYPYDGLLMDKHLYEALKDGFAEVFDYGSEDDDKPCVLYRGEDDDWDWPEDTTKLIGRTWVVVFDYHF